MAFSFPTSSDYYEGVIEPAITKAGTISVWVAPSGWASGDGALRGFWQHGNFNATPNYRLFMFQRYNDNKVYVGFEGDAAFGGEQRIIVNDTGMFRNGRFDNHVFTWDEGAGVCRYYWNGVIKGERTGGLTVPGSWVNNAFRFGLINTGGVLPTAGRLEHLVRYKRVLAAHEIALLARGGDPLGIKSIVSYYPLVGRFRLQDTDVVTLKRVAANGTPVLAMGIPLVREANLPWLNHLATGQPTIRRTGQTPAGLSGVRIF